MLNIYKTKAMEKLNKEDQEYNPNLKQHGIHLFKHHLMSGGTGLGKTNAVINLILTLQGCFNQIQIYTSDPTEKLYLMLKNKLKDKLIIDEIQNIPPYREQKTAGQQLLVIDDFIEMPKSVMTKIEEYSTQSRKKLFTCCFLTQSFFKCPKKIREQIRYINLLKSGDKRNLNLIISSLDTDIDPKTIKNCIKSATHEALNICSIDLQQRDINKTIRRNFGNDFYVFEDSKGNHIEPEMFFASGIIN